MFGEIVRGERAAGALVAMPLGISGRASATSQTDTGTEFFGSPADTQMLIRTRSEGCTENAVTLVVPSGPAANCNHPLYRRTVTAPAS